MNSKDFDDALRKKIESVSFDNISNADVDKVMSHVHRNRKPFSNKNKRFAVYAVVLVALILGLVGLNMYQLKDRQLLSRELDSLKLDLASNQIITKHDTILIHDQSIANHNEISSNEVSSNLNVTSVSSRKLSQQNSVLVNKNNQRNQSNPKQSLASISNENTAKNSPTYVPQLPNKTVDINEGITTENNSKQNGIVEAKNDSSPANELVQMIQVKVDSALEATQLTNLKSDDTSDVGSIVSPDKVSHRLQNMSLQLGLLSDFSQRQLSAGIAARINFSNHFSLQIGLQKSNYVISQFNDEVEYKKGRREDFRKTYALTTIDTSKVTNIDIQYRCIQLPIALQWLNRIGNHLHLVTSLASTFDLKVKEIASYRPASINISNDKRPLHVERKISSPFFNNFNASVGVEKELKRLTIGLSPSLSYQLSPVNYRNNKINIGATFRILYNI